MDALPEALQLAPHGTYAPGGLTRFVLMLSQNTFLGRGKARKFMAACVRRLSDNQLDAKLFGQNVRLHMHNNSSEVKALMKPGRYARSELDFCATHLPEAGGVFVDVGANAGLFSLGVLQHMTTGKLVAIEPQPTLFERLRLNLQDFNPREARSVAFSLHNLAVGAENGHLNLYIPDQLGQASFHALPDAKPVEVRIRPLASILAEAGIEHVDVLKIDVEGYEDEALLPFFATASRQMWPQAIIIEHCHRDRWKRNCQEELIQIGYDLVDQDRTNLMFSKRVG